MEQWVRMVMEYKTVVPSDMVGGGAFNHVFSAMSSSIIITLRSCQADFLTQDIVFVCA